MKELTLSDFSGLAQVKWIETPKEKEKYWNHTKRNRAIYFLCPLFLPTQTEPGKRNDTKNNTEEDMRRQSNWKFYLFIVCFHDKKIYSSRIHSCPPCPAHSLLESKFPPHYSRPLYFMLLNLLRIQNQFLPAMSYPIDNIPWVSMSFILD